MPSFADINVVNTTMIRKGLEGVICVKRWAAADTAIATLKDATGLLALPTGYKAVGLITKDQGASWSRDITTSDTQSLGQAEDTRRDVTADVSGLQFTAQESTKHVFEMYDGVNLTGVTQDANGNVYYDKPARPATIYYRGLALFKDGDGVDAVYFAKWLPRFSITDRGEQVWNDETEVQYPMTATAFSDPTFGTSIRTLWAGPAATLTAMGFATA